VNHAPQDGQTPALIQAIGPALIQLAEQLNHGQYYVVQSADQRWLTTILSNRGQPDQEKTVIHAYATAQDAEKSISPGAGRTQVVGVPVLHLLFQLIAMQPVDSLLFFDTPHDRGNALEVERSALQDLVKQCLQAYKAQRPAPPYPPNLA